MNKTHTWLSTINSIDANFLDNADSATTESLLYGNGSHNLNLEVITTSTEHILSIKISGNELFFFSLQALIFIFISAAFTTTEILKRIILTFTLFSKIIFW